MRSPNPISPKKIQFHQKQQKQRKWIRKRKREQKRKQRNKIGKQKEYQQGVGTVNHIYQGSGNISQIVFGNAVKLGNHFSVGLNMNYMFGNQTYIKKNEYWWNMILPIH